ncbi:hypothetical protein GW17_00060292 [Ensete ventricosum]|nr:hypothetical protein GW17_00060292 [Ensete ventricosum]
MRRGSQPRPAPMQGRPPTARAIPQGRSMPLAGAAARRGDACGNTRLQRDARKGGRLQGACKGLLPATNSGHPLVGGCRWARVATAYVGAAMATTAMQIGQEGLGHPFEKRMILPL